MLKRLLREKGLAWPSPYSLSGDASDVAQCIRMTRTTRSTHGNLSALGLSVPYLPVEILLKILTYALTSPFPILDPLCKISKDTLTAAEKGRGNQIAIHFLATCKAYHVEGKIALWTQNTFAFSTVQAVKAFADVDLVYRRLVSEANFRIIVRFQSAKSSMRGC